LNVPKWFTDGIDLCALAGVAAWFALAFVLLLW
jgi:hypothetical protein